MRGSKKDLYNSSNPAFYCIDCSVMRCWKEKDGFHCVGSTIDATVRKCSRPKRMYDWKEIERWKKRQK